MSNLVPVEVNGYIIHMSPDDAAQTTSLLERAEYLDKRQYLLKIQMNSLYGALSNPHFRFFDPRLGNSTTGTGRFVLEHMAKTVGEFFDGKYEYPTPSAVYGDTDSAYFATGAETVDEAVVKADAFAKQLNDGMPDFMRKTFLCKGKYATQINTAREVVADRGIFVSKKMYMLHIVNMKGKPVDKMKVMGLTLKKTLVPKQISEDIQKVFEALLKGELDWRGFNLAILKLRQDLVDSADTLLHANIDPDDIKLLGKPNTVKDMNKYGDRVQRYVKSDKIPGHVRAAAAYNKALRVFDDKLNEPISSGTKIKLYYLKTPEGFVKAIAIPTDVNPIPQWFLEYYWPKVDLRRQLLGIFDSPIQQILSSLGKTVPTKNHLVADECLEF